MGSFGVLPLSGVVFGLNIEFARLLVGVLHDERSLVNWLRTFTAFQREQIFCYARFTFFFDEIDELLFISLFQVFA